MRVTNTGNVGINTTPPQDKLHIYDGDLRIQGTNNHYVSINQTRILKYDNSTFGIGTYHNQSFNLKTNNSNRMTITDEVG